MSREEYMTMLVTIIVLFCASGTGIYGSLDSGMSGDHTILISKSILDFFTAMIFGGTLGMVVAAVAIPQCVIFLAIFAAAKFIFPAYNAGDDRGLQGLRRFPSSGHRFPNRKDPQLPGC
ncbi:MAG: DUF554 family protein [Lachnospiraceae bacterium]